MLGEETGFSSRKVEKVTARIEVHKVRVVRPLSVQSDSNIRRISGAVFGG